MRRIGFTTFVLLLITNACSTKDSSDSTLAPTASSTISPTELAPLTPAPAELLQRIATDIAGSPAGCDSLDPSQCVLPFPSNGTTIADPSSVTGRRVAFPADGLPANDKAEHINPEQWNRNDGFSPNSSILTEIANLDAEASHLPSWTDLESSLAPEASVVIIDSALGTRVPLWAELDMPTDDTEPLLTIHPALALSEGHTYIVAVRALVTTDGSLVQPSGSFLAFRDRLETPQATIENRRSAMEILFSILDAAGIERASLQLAWDFTVASTENLTSRILTARDNTLAWLQANKLEYSITAIVPASKEDVAVQVAGTFKLPTHLTDDGSPGQSFNYDPADNNPDRLPVIGEIVDVPFLCQIPKMAVDDPSVVLHPGLYGHGLLGSEYEIDYGGDVRALAQEAGVLFCATKWAGMSEDDVGNAVISLQNLSNFPTVADRLQQGIVNMIALGRIMTTDGGLLSDPAFGGAKIAGDLIYYGNSQGGIMGSALTAVSPDISRAVLGVTGINYSILLSRSVDFKDYEAIMVPAYPSRRDRTLAISVMQMLWDRGEGGGYINHISGYPLPGTQPFKAVLMHVAWGDHQVSELSAFVEARSLGATLHQPMVSAGRSREVTQGWGLDAATEGDTGSVMVIWDSGSEMIPIEVIAPSTGIDPHEHPRDAKIARSQMADFLFKGIFTDVCAGKPCTAQPS